MVAAGSITVCVRVRPPTEHEAARLPQQLYESPLRGDGALAAPVPITQHSSLRDIVQIIDDRIINFDPDEKDRARAFAERGFVPPGTKRYKDKRFMFDKVFDANIRQEDVFRSTTEPLLQPVLNGFNATVFAYGATGCGKTHTISGTEDDPGIIYLTMADLFQRIEDRSDDWTVNVTVTFLEIYNEEIRDLLAEPGTQAPRGGLQIREDKTVKVANLTELRPTSAEEVKAIVLQGNMRRTQSPTLANATSSRSHAVLQVHVSQAPRTASLNEERTLGTLSIIDLAGSERAAATTNMGKRMVEGANINKSLLALGNCINALCENGGATRHVPYRNSKLTRLLKFSLGGNCKTVMIVCVAPTSAHYDDTHNTLLYAERATKIKTKVITRNVVNVERHVGKYVEAITRLNQEVAELRAKLASKKDADDVIAQRKRAEAIAEAQNLRKTLEDKTNSSKSCVANGARCRETIKGAEINLLRIKARLLEIGQGELSDDQRSEKDLLEALAQKEEAVLSLSNPLQSQISESSKSENMFTATLNTLREMRLGKLDEINLSLVHNDASRQKALMENSKLEAQLAASRDLLAKQADYVIAMLGAMGRCTTLVAQVANRLADAADEHPSACDDLQSSSSILSTVASANAQLLQSFLGAAPQALTKPGKLASSDSYRDFMANLIRPSTPTQVHASTRKSKPRTSRGSVGGRISSIASRASTSTLPPTDLRRSMRSPKKAARVSLAPPRRPVAPPIPPPAAKEVVRKAVQWKDEAGQGKLDDANESLLSSASVNSANDSGIRTVSGMDSEWEDEPISDPVPDENTSISAVGRLRKGPAKPRSSLMNPKQFLRDKVRVMDSLVEEPSTPQKGDSPFGSRNGNISVDGIFQETIRPRELSPSRRPSTAPRSTGRRRLSALNHLGPSRHRRSSVVANNVSPRVSPRDRPRRVASETNAESNRTPARRIARTASVGGPPGRVTRSPSASTMPTWR